MRETREARVHDTDTLDRILFVGKLWDRVVYSSAMDQLYSAVDRVEGKSVRRARARVLAGESDSLADLMYESISVIKAFVTRERGCKIM